MNWKEFSLRMSVSISLRYFGGNSRVVFVYTGVIPFSCGIFVNSLITSIVVRKVSFPILVFSMKLIKSGDSLR